VTPRGMSRANEKCRQLVTEEKLKVSVETACKAKSRGVRHQCPPARMVAQPCTEFQITRSSKRSATGTETFESPPSVVAISPRSTTSSAGTWELVAYD